jgi:hypothetical protein
MGSFSSGTPSAIQTPSVKNARLSSYWWCEGAGGEEQKENRNFVLTGSWAARGIGGDNS